MIFCEQLADGAPEIPQEAVGVRSAFDINTGERREPRPWIVAAPLLELFKNMIGPVLRADFDAVGEQP